ncbi:putative ABC transporter permease [Luxibacter massiliensis]|uniref:putative ABC transporter permease n=1 Tax=Luxibacter massiliensis TaxID=2219695 RepID=UPI000F06648C|nr:putative ABC transporter permease [Luxibacter massiliensis]
MWDKMIFGNDLYHVILWFLTYSILGWLVESIYMSICNRRWTNRGFSRGPICPIYGIGALTVYFLLSPYSHNRVLLFFLGAILATTIEWVTARIMEKMFGEIWWDYTDKPFNYKGILCLESTLAWGLYTLILFGILHAFVERIVNAIPFRIGRIAGILILLLYLADFVRTVYQEKKGELPASIHRLKDRFRNLIGR